MMSGPPRYTRAAFRRRWAEAGQPWDRVPAHHAGRNTAIARAYLETRERGVSIAARHGVSPSRVQEIAESVVWATLGLRPPH
jgi:hypothetical protein